MGGRRRRRISLKIKDKRYRQDKMSSTEVEGIHLIHLIYLIHLIHLIHLIQFFDFERIFSRQIIESKLSAIFPRMLLNGKTEIEIMALRAIDKFLTVEK